MDLTTLSKRFRKGVKVFGGVAFIYYLLILFLIPRSRNFIRSLTPDRNPPNPVFGKLDVIKLEPKPINGPKPKYVLNTQNGKLPEDLPLKVKVYKFTPSLFSYSAKRNALENAKFLGFAEKDLVTDLKEDVYKWRSLLSTGSLEINTKNQALVLDTNLFGKANEYKSGSVNQQTAKTAAIQLFTKLDRIDSDKDTLYSKGKQNIYLGKFEGNTIIETKLTNEAQIARVDLFRNIEQLPILGPDPKKGLLHTILKNPTVPESPFNYPKVEANYWEIDPVTTAVYPLIPVEEAWTEVSEGRGVITNVSPKDWNPFLDYTPVRVDSILIDKIYLAYYETPEFQKYLQPIYVFEGKFTTRGTEGGDITLYFPAINGEFINTPTEQPAANTTNTNDQQ